MKTILITGSAGLVGSACVRLFHDRGWKVVGIDNNQRLKFFGAGASTRPIADALMRDLPNYEHHPIDLRAHLEVLNLFRVTLPDAVVHAAAQPAHEWGERLPADNWAHNVTATLNVLEAARHNCPEAPFIFMSTSKVYGSIVNTLPMHEAETRFEYIEPRDGLNEEIEVDRSAHTQYGASKLAADILVQDYGRSFNMQTVCLRLGCVTGANHQGVPMHGFLSNLVKTLRRGDPYTIHGYKGKQVRDQLHAKDVAFACELVIARGVPFVGAVYNLGGRQANSISILEAIKEVSQRLEGSPVGMIDPVIFEEDEPRYADQIIVVNDTRRFAYVSIAWRPTPLDKILDELVEAELARA